MQEGTPSRTAAWVAAARHLGQLLPPEARLADDPYGAAFASPRLARRLEKGGPRMLAGLPGARHFILYMQVRTRVLDDAVRAFVAEGGRQLVLLGAGYDCRALRLPELQGAAVFEIDHPATQGHKQGVLAKLGAASPSRYVTWDFEARPMSELGGALAAAGHDPAAPTLTIWEGVTMYLTEPAIDASLRAVAGWSAPGSRLAMTYVGKPADGTTTLSTRVIKSIVSTLGEPWRFAWIPSELPAYLSERGFQLDRDLAVSDAATELLPAKHAKKLQSPERRIALAVTYESIASGRVSSQSV